MAPVTADSESAQPLKPSVSNLRRQYALALKRFCVDADEAALGRGYEIGRLALEGGLSLLEIVMLHEDAFAEVRDRLVEDRERPIDPRASKAAAQFLAETLVPF